MRGGPRIHIPEKRVLGEHTTWAEISDNLLDPENPTEESGVELAGCRPCRGHPCCKLESGEPDTPLDTDLCTVYSDKTGKTSPSSRTVNTATGSVNRIGVISSCSGRSNSSRVISSVHGSGCTCGK